MRVAMQWWLICMYSLIVDYSGMYILNLINPQAPAIIMVPSFLVTAILIMRYFVERWEESHVNPNKK